MKTREQKIMQAIRIYQKLYMTFIKTEKCNKPTIDERIIDCIMSNVNNPDFFVKIDEKCDFETMTVDELYEGFMKEDIIYL